MSFEEKHAQLGNGQTARKSYSREMDRDQVAQHMQPVLAGKPACDYGPNTYHEVTVALCWNKKSDFAVLRVPVWLLHDQFFVHVERLSKDGPALIYAGLHDQRCDAAVESVSAFTYEIDGKLALADADRVVRESGCEAILYTTHNHCRTKQDVTLGRYHRWMECKVSPTDEDVRRFCAQDAKYSHLKNVRLADGGKVRKERVYGNQVEVFDIAHDPEDKLRIVFWLEVPIVLGNGGISIEEFKAIYLAFGESVFGNVFSPESRNPSRLHYLPSHRPGAPFALHRYEGTLTDWHPIHDRVGAERAEAREKKRKQHTRLASVGLKELEHVIKYIPADCEYPVWFKVIAAIFHETKGSEEGAELAHDWSSGDPRYDFDQVERIWDALDPDYANPATMGSLVYEAREHDNSFMPLAPIRQLNDQLVG